MSAPSITLSDYTSGTPDTITLIGAGSKVNVMGGSGYGYTPGMPAPDVRRNASLYVEGDRPVFARSGNVTDVFTVDITGSSIDDCMDQVEKIQTFLDKARDISIFPGRRDFIILRVIPDSTVVTTETNYAIVFGGAIVLPETLLESSLIAEYTIENVQIVIEREPYWRYYLPSRYDAGTSAQALITPSPTLTTGNYALPFGTIYPNAAILGRAPALTELQLTPISGGAINIGNVVVGSRSIMRFPQPGTSVPYPGGILEAEAGTLGTDASLVVDATASPGSGNSAVEVSYATGGGADALRVTFTAPASNYFQGTYRVFARVKLTAAATTALYIKYQRKSTSTPITNASVAFTSTGWTMVDLGLMTTDTAGTDVFQLSTLTATDTIKLYSSRTAGAGLLRIDAIVLVPADEYYLTWSLAGSTFAANGAAIIRASTLEPGASGNFMAVEQYSAGDDTTPSSQLAFPAGIGTGMLYWHDRTQLIVYVIGDSSWGTTWSAAGANKGCRWRLRAAWRSYGLKGTT